MYKYLLLGLFSIFSAQLIANDTRPSSPVSAPPTGSAPFGAGAGAGEASYTTPPQSPAAAAGKALKESPATAAGKALQGSPFNRLSAGVFHSPESVRKIQKVKDSVEALPDNTPQKRKLGYQQRLAEVESDQFSRDGAGAFKMGDDQATNKVIWSSPDRQKRLKDAREAAGWNPIEDWAHLKAKDTRHHGGGHIETPEMNIDYNTVVQTGMRPLVDEKRSMKLGFIKPSPQPSPTGQIPSGRQKASTVVYDLDPISLDAEISSGDIVASRSFWGGRNQYLVEGNDGRYWEWTTTDDINPLRRSVPVIVVKEGKDATIFGKKYTAKKLKEVRDKAVADGRHERYPGIYDITATLTGVPKYQGVLYQDK